MELNTPHLSRDYVFCHADGTIITLDGFGDYKNTKKRLDKFTNNKKGFRLQKEVNVTR